MKATKKNHKYCVWEFDDIDCFYKMCGEHTFMFTDQEEKPKDFKFCPYCGLRIKTKRIF